MTLCEEIESRIVHFELARSRMQLLLERTPALCDTPLMPAKMSRSVVADCELFERLIENERRLLRFCFSHYGPSTTLTPGG